MQIMATDLLSWLGNGKSYLSEKEEDSRRITNLHEWPLDRNT